MPLSYRFTHPLRHLRQRLEGVWHHGDLPRPVVLEAKVVGAVPVNLPFACVKRRPGVRKENRVNISYTL